jgi:hypothetical protein
LIAESGVALMDLAAFQARKDVFWVGNAQEELFDQSSISMQGSSGDPSRPTPATDH